jgi:uncharacterized cupredoxin-like copper-binding protein
MKKIAITLFALCSLTALLASALPATGATKAKTVTVTAGKPSEFGYIFSTKTLALGAVTFKMTNKGALPHDLKICSSNKGGSANSCTGKGTPVISPGKTTSVTVTFTKKGTYEYLCTVPGHAAAGMKGDLKVT